MPML